MKKTVLSVIWLAIAGVFTTMTMSACSDDDDNNSSNSGGITIEGVDQAVYFRKNLGLFAENDSILLPLRMTVLDALNPNVYSYFVEDVDEAEMLFLAWIPEKAREGVSRNGSTIVYTPRDAQGAPQGTIMFRAALPTETATLAVVEFNGVGKMKGIDKIKFQPESAMPDNLESNMLPKSLYLTQIENGSWFYRNVPKEEIFSLHDASLKRTYYYTYPLKVHFGNIMNVGFDCIAIDGWICYSYGMDHDPSFKAEVIKRFKEHQTEIFIAGGYYQRLQVNSTSFYSYHFDGDELIYDRIILNRNPNDDCWLVRGYIVKDGENFSIPGSLK